MPTIEELEDDWQPSVTASALSLSSASSSTGSAYRAEGDKDVVSQAIKGDAEANEEAQAEVEADSDDDSDFVESDGADIVNTNASDNDNNSESNDDSLPDLVEDNPTLRASLAASHLALNDNNILDGEDDDDDDVLDDAVEGDGESVSAPRRFRPKYGDKSPLLLATESCCDTTYLHVLGLCNSAVVFSLKMLMSEKKLAARENVLAHKKMLAAESNLMDHTNSLSPQELKREEELVEQSWVEINRLEKKIELLSKRAKDADSELVLLIKRAHERLGVQYGRTKNSDAFDPNIASAKSADRLHSARQYQQYNGRKSRFTETAAANMLCLSEIDKAYSALIKPKFRQEYLFATNDSNPIVAKRRTPRYADKGSKEVLEKDVPVKQEPVWAIMKRQRAGALARRGYNPNRIERVVLLEYPTQPTCPKVTVNDTTEGRYVTISWGLALAEERKIDRCEVSLKANGGLWNPIWAGDVNNCTFRVEDYGFLQFRVRFSHIKARNELGWGVHSIPRDLNIGKWKPLVSKNKKLLSNKKKSVKTTSESSASTIDLDTAVSNLNEKISHILANNSDLGSRSRALTELLGMLPAITKHHAHLPILSKQVASAIAATEVAEQKKAKQITNTWRARLSAMSTEIVKTPDVSFSTSINKAWSNASEFSELLELMASQPESEEAESMTAQSRNQIWQAVSGLYTKRPIKLVSVVLNGKKVGLADGVQVIITPGLAVLKKISRVVNSYVEAVESGVVSGGSDTQLREWIDVLARQIERALEREEGKADEIVKAEAARIEAEATKVAERERKEAQRIEAENRRRAIAEEKERVLIEKRLAEEEIERREIQMRENLKRAELTAREQEVQRQKMIDDAKSIQQSEQEYDVQPNSQLQQYQQHQSQLQLPQQQQQQTLETYTPSPSDASAKIEIKVVRIPRNKNSVASNLADVPVSVERVYRSNIKFGSHGEEDIESVAVAAPKTQVVCKFFQSNKGCRNGDNCPMLHEKSISKTPVANNDNGNFKINTRGRANVNSNGNGSSSANGISSNNNSNTNGNSNGSINGNSNYGTERLTQPERGSLICKYFNTKFGCKSGDECRFAHLSKPNTGSQNDNANYRFDEQIEDVFKIVNIPNKLVQAFKEHDIRNADFTKLTDQDLQAVGFLNANLRKRLLNQLKKTETVTGKYDEVRNKDGPVILESSVTLLNQIGVECSLIEQIPVKDLVFLDETKINANVEEGGFGVCKIGQVVRMRAALEEMKARGVATC
ncbi:hypothetical protein HK100_011117 [Physocladia obscura]|uniref:C3H1-type domain-containing protein n=1 Tax=Physocladia obscura TaxID=109957 RepID=A0AAD5XH78_9FUNG|nr:hypothetical protein HK100_011117 [Physocladia obscura]